MTDNIGQVAQTQTLASLLAFDIQERRKRELRKKISAYPRTISILSDIGECDRQLTYAVLNWQDRPLHDEELQARFDEGREQERKVNRELLDLGYDIAAQQEVVEIKNRKGEAVARGKIDGKIVYQRAKIPYEVKSMNPNVYDQIDEVDDFQKKPYLRKYIRQLQMYLFGNNCEEGLLICTDCLGHFKIFVVTLDYGEAEQIIQRLERVHEAIKAKALPDRIVYRDEICGKCAFAHICLPDVLRKELNVLTDEDLIFYLNEREMNKSSKTIYESADGWVKKFLKKYNIEKGIAGDFAIVGKLMPAKKPSEKEPQPYMVYSIRKVSEIEKPVTETV